MKPETVLGIKYREEPTAKLQEWKCSGDYRPCRFGACRHRYPVLAAGGTASGFGIFRKTAKEKNQGAAQKTDGVVSSCRRSRRYRRDERSEYGVSSRLPRNP